MFKPWWAKKRLCISRFAPEAVYVAIGPNSQTELKRVIELKPAPTTAVEFFINPKRAAKLGEQLGEGVFKQIVKQLPESDRLVPLYSVEVHGGTELRVRYTNVLGRVPIGVSP